ncbi:MAG: site-specific integrase, partial [Anaerolineae bacterium]|nr:site-specific integrase [Anaerolineae bacterium]
MNTKNQLPLFADLPPQSANEIHKKTALKHTYALFLQFLKESGKSEHTLKAFDADLRLAGSYLDDSRTIGELTTTDLNDFLYWLENGRGVPCSRKSYARRVTTLKVYFRWLKGLGAIPLDPAKAVLQRSGPAPLSDVLSFAQIEACIEASRTFRKGEHQDYRPEMLFRLCADTGMKKGEVMALKPEDIDRSNPYQPIVTIRHKSRNVYKERRIPLDPDWLLILDAYLDQYPQKADKNGHKKPEIITCTARNLEYILTDIGTAARLPFNLSFEVLRWT